jgi:hypothetical protein
MNSEHLRLKMSELLLSAKSAIEKHAKPQSLKKHRNTEVLILDLSLSNESDVLAVESLVRYSIEIQTSLKVKLIICGMNQKVNLDWETVIRVIMKHGESEILTFIDLRRTLQYLKQR